MDTLRRDVRFALRTFSRRKAIALGAVASLAIVIAANTTVFSVANGLLLKGVSGVTRRERLVEISRADGRRSGPLSRMARERRAVLVLGMPVLVATVVGTAMVAPIRRLVRASPMTNLRED